MLIDLVNFLRLFLMLWSLVRVQILGGALDNLGLPDEGFLILDFLFEASAYQKPICWG